MMQWKEKDTYQEHRHRHAERSCPFARDGGYDQRGTGDRPWPIGTGLGRGVTSLATRLATGRHCFKDKLRGLKKG